MEKKRFWTMILYLFIGCVLGTASGIALGKVFPVFGYKLEFGFTPFTLNLIVANVTLGFKLFINLGTLLGAVLFFYLFLIL
ncbi:MAG: DUF4321 domain-containing protein [Caldisericaceae bacterium]|nr:DUF4321 domain-containing protein [Caldisericaceae bacterium]